MKFVLGGGLGLCSLVIFIMIFGSSFIFLYSLAAAIITIASTRYFSKFEGGFRECFLGKDFDYEEARKRQAARWRD